MNTVNKKDVGQSLIQNLIALIPGYGGVLNEVLFEYRGKIKQKRLNDFVELLMNYFSNHKGIDLENFQTVEFGDLFESVLKKVILTQSAEKLKMLKNILISQLENPSQNIDDSEVYLELISTLSEAELKILYEYRLFAKKFENQAKEVRALEIEVLKAQNNSGNSNIKSRVTNSNLENELFDLENNFGKKTNELNNLKNINNSSHFSLSNDQYLYYKQRLFSKGLLIDNAVGSIGGRPFQVMGITQFGVEFIDYISV